VSIDDPRAALTPDELSAAFWGAEARCIHDDGSWEPVGDAVYTSFTYNPSSDTLTDDYDHTTWQRVPGVDRADIIPRQTPVGLGIRWMRDATPR